MRGIIIMASLVVQGSFTDSSVGKESGCNAGNPDSIPGSGRFTGEGVGYPFQCSWTSLVMVRKEKKKKSTCQCRKRGFDPWVGKILWRRKWHPTPVFLPGKSHGQMSLATVHEVLKE